MKNVIKTENDTVLGLCRTIICILRKVQQDYLFYKSKVFFIYL